MNPGCMTQVRIVISVMVTPLDAITRDLLLITCPKNVTKTVTKDNSIVLANNAKSVDAVDGEKDPPECMVRP